MGRSKMLEGTPILMGDNTIPGLKIHKEVRDLIPAMESACKKMGLDYYPIIVEFVPYDDMAELASYGGFPVRYPHWRFGMEYESMARGYEYNQYRISEMVINCLGKSTKIPTQRGTLCASEIKDGDVIYSNNGPRTVAKVIVQSSSRTKRIKFLGQLNDIVSTPNHRWKIMTSNGPEWKTVDELKEGDLVIGGDTYEYYLNRPCELKWSPESVIEMTAPSVRDRLKPIQTPSLMTKEMAELLGAVCGDGSHGVVSRENMISVIVDKSLPEYQDHVRQLMIDVFGIEPIVEEKNSVNVLTICSKMAVNFFDQNGFPKGCTYKTKRVPDCIWASSNEFRAAFLRGLFDTDGYASDTLGFSAFNRNLVADVQLMLLEMGINSYAEERQNGKNTIWVCMIRGRESIFRFRDRIGFSISYKQSGLEGLTDTESCVSGGVCVEWAVNKCIQIGQNLGITPYNNPSLGRSLKAMAKKTFGFNAIYGFVLRAITAGHKEFFEVYDQIRNPIVVIKEITDDVDQETVDIALFDESHDFLANGLLSHNTSPCLIYCMDSNTLVDNINVICHAIGHNDFFKNNIFFRATDRNMMNKLANHGTRIRKYMARWGHEVVTEFIDHVLRIDTLIDYHKLSKKRPIKKVEIQDERKYRFPRRRQSSNDYMHDWVNSDEYLGKEHERVEEEDAADFLDIFGKPDKDIFGYLKNNAPLKPWQQDIMSMLYDESMYFAPQRLTKMLNEGWASFVDHYLLCRQGLVSLGQKSEDCGIIQYADHKWRVLGGKYSSNPYKLGYELLRDIEDRWNKGKFGSEWEECTDMKERAEWNKNLGLGLEKLFEVRKFHNDYTAILEFFTPELCRKLEFFNYRRFPNGEWKITDRDYKSIKSKLLKNYLNGGLPDIRLTDPNHLGKGWFFMQHFWDDRNLYPKYVHETITSVYRIWQRPVVLATHDADGEEEIVYVCDGPSPDGDVMSMKRFEYEKEYMGVKRK